MYMMTGYRFHGRGVGAYSGGGYVEYTQPLRATFDEVTALFLKKKRFDKKKVSTRCTAMDGVVFFTLRQQNSFASNVE